VVGSDAAVIPLYGFLQGDTIGLLVLASETASIDAIGRQLQVSASVRVKPIDHFSVLHRGRVLNPQITVEEAGLEPLDRVDVVARVALTEPPK
jgi:hypothetical protein